MGFRKARFLLPFCRGAGGKDGYRESDIDECSIEIRTSDGRIFLRENKSKIMHNFFKIEILTI